MGHIIGPIIGFIIGFIIGRTLLLARSLGITRSLLLASRFGLLIDIAGAGTARVFGGNTESPVLIYAWGRRDITFGVDRGIGSGRAAVARGIVGLLNLVAIGTGRGALGASSSGGLIHGT